jgi:Ca2+-binding RTX toxin-like protein
MHEPSTNDESRPELIRLANGAIVLGYSTTPITEGFGRLAAFDGAGDAIAPGPGGSLYRHSQIAAGPDGSFGGVSLFKETVQVSQSRPIGFEPIEYFYTSLCVFDTMKRNADGSVETGRFTVSFSVDSSHTTIGRHEFAILKNGQYAVSIPYLHSDGTRKVQLAIVDPTFAASGQPKWRMTVESATEVELVTQSNGDLAVVSVLKTPAGEQIEYQIFDAAGNAVTSRYSHDVWGSTNREISSVALADGGFAIAYTDNGWSGNNDITFSIFNADGTARLSWANASDFNAGGQARSAICQLDNGVIVVSFVDGDGSIYGRAYLPDGTPLSGQRMWLGVGADPTIVALPDSAGEGFGRFMLASTRAADGTEPGAPSTHVGGRVMQFERFVDGDGTNEALEGRDDMRDVIFGLGGADLLHGYRGNDRLEGGIGADALVGGSGKDEVLGDADDDALIVGAGDTFAGEIYDGGAGADRIWFRGVGVASFQGSTIRNTEKIEFDSNWIDWGNVGKAIVLDAAAFTGSASTGLGIGAQLVFDTLARSNIGVVMGAQTVLDLTFVQVLNQGADDFLQVLGDETGETVFGNAANEVMYANAGDDALYGDGGNDYLDGGQGADLLNGGAGADYLFGGVEGEAGSADFDELRGGAGDDTLDGGRGVDLMVGGQGDDTYVVDNENDGAWEDGGAGVDLVNTMITLADLDANIKNGTIVGTGALDLGGNGENNTLRGNASSNTLRGFDGVDTLVGNDGLDILEGGAGGDRLFGGLGNDTLRGDAGADFYYFNTTPNGATNVDRIEGFLAVDDQIYIDDAAFAGLALGGLAAAAFRAAAGATTAMTTSHRIVYNTANGDLFYDRDGSGAAFGAIKFATVFGAPALTNADVLVY